MGKQLPVYGDGSQIRDWLHTNDHIAGILNIIESGQIGDTYNIGGNNELSNLHVIEMICDFMDKNFKNKHIKQESELLCQENLKNILKQNKPHKLNKKNIIIPPNEQKHKIPYPGGYVKEPYVGSHDWVGIFP